MFKLVFALSKTFTVIVRYSQNTETSLVRGWLQAGAHTLFAVQLRPRPSAAIWRACVTPSSASIMKAAVMADRHEVRGQSHDPIFDDVALLDISHCTR